MLLRILAVLAFAVASFLIYAISVNQKNKDLEYFNLGNKLASENKYDLAIENHLKALDLRTQKYKPSHQKVINSHKNLATLYKHKKLYSQALVHFSEVLSGNQAGDNNESVKSQLFSFEILNTIGECYYAQKDHESGLQSYGRALALPIVEGLHNRTLLTEEELKKDPLTDDEMKLSAAVVATLRQVVEGYQALGDMLSAVVILEKSLELTIVASKFDPDPENTEVADMSMLIANQYHRLNELEGALRNYLRALKMYHTKNDLKQTGTLYYNVGIVYSDMRDFTAANAYQQEALKAFEGNLDRAHKLWALVYSALGHGFYMAQELDQSAKYYLLYIEFVKTHQPDNKQSLAKHYFQLGNSLLADEKIDDAIPNFNSAIELWKTDNDLMSQGDVASAYLQLAVAYITKADLDTASMFEDKAAEVRSLRENNESGESELDVAEYALALGENFLRRDQQSSNSSTNPAPEDIETSKGLLKLGLRTLEKRFAPNFKNETVLALLTQIHTNLAVAYNLSGDASAALHWSDKLAKLPPLPSKRNQQNIKQDGEHSFEQPELESQKQQHTEF